MLMFPPASLGKYVGYDTNLTWYQYDWICEIVEITCSTVFKVKVKVNSW
jgi:hypothetical protein